jgi:hypothetical protein
MSFSRKLIEKMCNVGGRGLGSNPRGVIKLRWSRESAVGGGSGEVKSEFYMR